MEEEVKFNTHGDLPREAPGDSASTRKAFSMLETLPAHPHILEVGCGPGSATVDLLQVSGGKVTSVDISQPYLDELLKRAADVGLERNVMVSRQSMFEMDFPSHSFDLIWSEGAIYIIGLEKGLTEWKKFLRQKGYIVITELSWLTEKPSAEPKAFWDEHYKGMRTVEENLATFDKCGFTVMHHFALPESSWFDEFYMPWEEKLFRLQKEHADNPAAQNAIAKNLKEIELYRTYHNEYGYVFYIAELKS